MTKDYDNKMLTTSTEVEETKETTRQVKKKKFSFPSEHFSVEAETLAEAEQKLATYKSNSK